MKSTTNVFLEGLRTDLHPLSTSQKVLTDALNATMITYNGNEMMLQNDMGNTLIQDSATGNIMGLNPGFIPVGMKEHGGIMYIASVDKEGNGEIGTIPSPIIRDLYKDQVSLSIGKNIPIDSGDPVQITNKLYPTDKFIANLQMTIDETTLKGIPHKKVSELVEKKKEDPCDIILEKQIFIGLGPNNSIRTTSIYSPVISYSSDSKDLIELEGLVNPVTVRKKGIYNLNLYSFFEQGKSTAANQNLLSAQVYGANGDKTSLYWFLHTDSPISMFPKDLFNATLNNDLKQVPVSTKPGKLAVKLIPETITDFGMLPRALEPYNTPITYKTTDGLYYTYFPGFYYTSDSGLYVEKLTARVIDESTNISVALEYPYGKEVLFGRYNLSKLKYRQSSDDDYNDPFLNGGLKLWENSDNLGLPHSKDRSSNTQILSPIVGLHNSKSTNFKSSTQGKNDSPHSGVFRAVLGENYNRWYRLEVDYEDQYGGNKGTFTTRFNPYLNDVFGTNLKVDGKIYGNKLVIGTKTNISEQKVGLFRGDNITATYRIQIGLKKDLAFTDTTNVTIEEIDESPKGLYADCSLNPFTYLNDIPKEHSFTFEYDKAFDKSLMDPVSLYFYSSISVPVLLTPISYQLDTSIFNKEGAIPIQVATRGGYSGAKSTLVRGKRYILIDEMTINQQPFQFQNHRGNPQPLVFAIEEVTTERLYHNRHFPSVSASPIGLYSIINELLNKSECFVYNSPTNLLEFQKLDNTLSSNWNDSIVIPNTFEPQFHLTSSKESGTHLIDRVKYFCHGDLYLNYVSSYTQCSDSGVLTIPSTVLQPSYSIAPYFCLTGTIDGGTQVYIQRFGQTNNTDMVYQHNFELDNAGKTKNFIPEESSGKKWSTPCSYNEGENSSFLYYCENFSTSLELDAGIYVLNIQRCPGVGNWTATSTDPLVNLEIQIMNNDTTYSYSYPKQNGTKISENWSIDASDTNKYRYKTSHGETSNMRIYVPIVLIVQEASKVLINIFANGNYKFNRQSIGLYKINDVTDENIVQDLLTYLTEQVYLYHDYMKIIAGMAENHDPDKVKQYSFMLKYGVFFKEAFVFVDGLYKDNNVNSITIREKTYQPYPYIPSDPSILPVLIDANSNYYWNTYYMPEEVLNSDDCNFIFSNADGIAIIDDDDTFKSIKSGNLRQLINQE